jgi:hypothetical protein
LVRTCTVAALPTRKVFGLTENETMIGQIGMTVVTTHAPISGQLYSHPGWIQLPCWQTKDQPRESSDMQGSSYWHCWPSPGHGSPARGRRDGHSSPPSSCCN